MESATILTPLATTQKRPKIGFKDQLSLNAGQKYWREGNTFDLH